MELFTTQSKVIEILQHPLFAQVRKYLFYTAQAELEGPQADFIRNAAIADLAAVGWSAEGIAGGLNCLAENLTAGRVSVHPVYDPADCWDDPQKKNVSLICMKPEKPDSSLPFIVLCAGGGYASVCTMVEALPAARHFLKAGYTVFLMTYRVSSSPAIPHALEDLAQAFRWLRAHSGELSIHSDRYAVGGFSAGGNLTVNWGSSRIGYAAYGLPKPLCLFAVYALTDLREFRRLQPDDGMAQMWLGAGWEKEIDRYNVIDHVDEAYPPCYIVCGKDDATVSPSNSEELAARLTKAGVACVLEEAEHAQHGFGDGTGTGTEGWPGRAMAFLQTL